MIIDSASPASSRDRDELVLIVQNPILSQADEMSPATVRTTDEGGEDTVEGTMEERIVECSLLTGSSELELREVRGEKAPPIAALNEYEVRVKNVVKKEDEENLNVMVLLRGLKRSKQEVEPR